MELKIGKGYVCDKGAVTPPPKASRDNFNGVPNAKFGIVPNFAIVPNSAKFSKRAFLNPNVFSNPSNQTIYFKEFYNSNYKDFQIHQNKH